MKLVLLKDIKGTGKSGEVIEVKDGFARYLLNSKSAKEATFGALEEVKAKKKSKERELAIAKENAQKIFEKINNQTVTLKIAAGISGKIHESITNAKISDALKKEFDVDIDRRKIVLSGSEHVIKTFGMHSVNIQLFTGISAKVIVNVLGINE